MNRVTALRRAAALAAVGLATTLWIGCSDNPSLPLTGPASRTLAGGAGRADLAAALAAQRRHTPALLRIPGVVGTAVGLLPDGRAAVRIFLEHDGVAGVPSVLDGVPAAVQVTGRFMARSDPTRRARPAPIGFSVGHPSITAGSIGARVVDGSGNVYVLSNNHVLANSNDALLGDPTLQPGPFDGGTSADQIGTLSAFQPIGFSLGDSNFIDAAIARSALTDLGNATPSDEGYGTPSATIHGDANADGVFDDVSALLGLTVQKYGRTTRLTTGQITGINASVEICYEVLIFICVKSALFVDQLIIEPGTFSGGGDSGSLIVSADADHHPVALLFAGSSAQTIANRIDHVLNRFGVRVDGSNPPPPPPPPTPSTDLAVTSVSAPGSVTQGATATVTVTVRNTGTEAVGAFTVTLRDTTDNVTIGSQGVAGLAAGAQTSLPFAWNTAGSTLGTHTLIARHDLADDSAANDVALTTSAVTPPSVAIHVGDLDGQASDDGTTWSAIVEITVHDANHVPVNGATVVGTWSRSGLNANECTTGELGGSGTCIVLFPSLRRNAKFVSFTVTSVTMPGNNYVATQNHDVDGSSNGTTVRVNRP